MRRVNSGGRAGTYSRATRRWLLASRLQVRTRNGRQALGLGSDGTRGRLASAQAHGHVTEGRDVLLRTPQGEGLSGDRSHSSYLLVRFTSSEPEVQKKRTYQEVLTQFNRKPAYDGVHPERGLAEHRRVHKAQHHNGRHRVITGQVQRESRGGRPSHMTISVVRHKIGRGKQVGRAGQVKVRVSRRDDHGKQKEGEWRT